MTHSVPRPSASAAESPPARIWLAAFALGLAVLAAYHNSFGVPFLFDDIPSIVENPDAQRLWPVVTDQPGGLTTSGRPVVAFSFALNHLIHGQSVAGYHVVNLAIHLAAGWLLLGLVRRTLLLPSLCARFGGAALPLAGLIAAVWTLHPLQTESVTYVVQRAESLAGFFYLATLYAFVRSTASERPAGWQLLSVVACTLGMASKETVVTAPLVVLLYDRTFVSGGLGAAWRRRPGLYLALGSTWAVLALLVVATSGRGGTAGLGVDMSPWTYALTQSRAIVIYLERTLWPQPLIFDYGLATAGGLAEVLPYALMVLGLLVGAVIALVRRPVAGFLAAAFFLLLAPSSSFVPVVTQTMAEHRMYLPLAPVLAGLAAGLYQRSGVIGLVGLGAAAAALAFATAGRNHDFRSETAIWADTAAKLPGNARAHNNLGQALDRAGRTGDAMACYDRALQLQPNYPETHYNLGVALARTGQDDRAIGHYEAALRFQPGYPEAHNNLGNALVRTGRVPAAISHYEQALALRPDFAEAHNNLGNALLQADRAVEAEAHFRRAVVLRPDYAEAHYNLGNARAAAGAMADALVHYERALAARSDYAEAWVNAGNATLALGRPVDALVYYRRAVALNPKLADAYFNLGSTLLELGRWAEAIAPFESALNAAPDSARAERGLAYALVKAGRPAEATVHYERYLRAVPDDAEAREEWRRLRASVSENTVRRDLP